MVYMYLLPAVYGYVHSQLLYTPEPSSTLQIISYATGVGLVNTLHASSTNLCIF